MIQTLARVVALLALALIVYATLSSIDARPRTGHVGFEREAAFFLLALALTIGFPSEVWLVAIGVVIATIGLELAQNLTPDRHGEIIDAIQKIIGGMAGVGVGLLANRFLPPWSV